MGSCSGHGLHGVVRKSGAGAGNWWENCKRNADTVAPKILQNLYIRLHCEIGGIRESEIV